MKNIASEIAGWQIYIQIPLDQRKRVSIKQNFGFNQASNIALFVVFTSESQF